MANSRSATPIVTACNEFPGTPPAGVLLQGEHVLTRLRSGEDLSPADIFDWSVAETEEVEGVYTIDPDSRIEVNGGFSLLFTRP